jgi:hypothetical protein
VDFVLVVGKYFFLAFLYLFVFFVYRAILRDVRGAVVSDPPEEHSRARVDVSHSPSQQPQSAMSPPGPAPAPLGAGHNQHAAAPGAAACLVVVQSPDLTTLRLGTLLPLSAATAIGRSSENAVVLPDRFVSDRHALVYLAQGKHMLKDRDSTNGTFVNGERVHYDVVLRGGDRLEIGTTILEYRQ